MRRLILILLWPLFSLALPLAAQSALADSLARRLATQRPDTTRVRLLVDYAWEINEVRPAEAAERLREALELARRLADQRGEAGAWNGLGVVEEIGGNYPLARQQYEKALNLRRALGDSLAIASSLNNLANVLELQSDFQTALEYRQESLRLAESIGDTLRVARAHFNLAGLYQNMALYPEAFDELTRARFILEARGDLDGLAMAYTEAGHLKFELDDYREARRYYQQALRLRERLGDPTDLAKALTNLGNALDEMGSNDSSSLALTHYMGALRLYEELGDSSGLAVVYANLGDVHKHLGNYSLALDYLERARRIRTSQDDQEGLMEVYNTYGDVLRRMGRYAEALNYTERYFALAQKLDDGKYIQGAYKDFAEVYAALGDFKRAYEFRVRYDEYRYERLNEQTALQFAQKEAKFSRDLRRQDQERQQHQLELRDAQIARARTLRNALAGGAVALALLVGLLLNRSRIRAAAQRNLEAKNAAIERERARADDLLRNILPATTALELLERKSVQPVRYEAVTVLFSDFKDFTRIAEHLSPEALVAELDTCFRLFDAIIERHGMEKIKTIGDAYMCAGGLPLPNTTHALDAVRAALDMQRELSALMAGRGERAFEMRIGIHTGPVVAGVVGSHKFAYDIWGDTVNTAARMEETGEPGRVNISESTYQVIKEHYSCVYRGKLPAKNKGEIAMYFVEG